MAIESILGGMAAKMGEDAFKQQLQYQYQKNLNSQAQVNLQRNIYP